MIIQNNFKKENISEKLSTKTGLSVVVCKKLVNDLILIAKSKIKNDTLILKNIGTFKVIQKNKRIGRNPKTKQTFVINSRKSIRFTPSKNLSKKINKIV